MDGNAIVSNDTLKGIADAIRTKDGTSEPMLVGEMAARVAAIPSGGTDERVNAIVSRTIENLEGDDITSIGNNAFYGCYALTTVSLPNATSIGYYVFPQCTALTTVSLPNATSVGMYAFYYCPALTEVSLPNATSIGNKAFYYCTALTSIDLSSISYDDVVANVSNWAIAPASGVTCVITCKDGTYEVVGS